MDPLIGTVLKGYRLDRAIAAGGMASVYLAHHETTGLAVAAKILARDLRRHRDPLARILQEGRVICSLRHEHIVRVFDYGTADEDIGFVIMEHLEGRTLGEIIAAEGPMDPQRVIFIARQICAGLGAAHARGVFHRDIKPDNVMLADGQRFRDFVKLLDFGIAKLDADDPAKLAATATGVTLGTPQYMSPEQVQAKRIDERSDVYQMGALMYEALTGDPPFLHRNPVHVMAMHLNQAPRPIRERRPAVSVELEAVVARCLAKNPADRYPNATALSDALQTAAQNDDADGTMARTQIHKRGRRSPAVVGDLRLPSLGNPADRDRYTRGLAELLPQLWPDGTAPTEITDILAAIARLRDDLRDADGQATSARAAADELARALEQSERPLERAITALGEEESALRQEVAAEEAALSATGTELEALDARYATIHHEVESRQSALYGAPGSATGPVDFRELFREDIAAHLADLEGIYHQRTGVAAQLVAAEGRLADLQPRLADLELQLCELNKSLLTVHADRAARLAGLELAVRRLENESRATERAIEHRCLQLGLAFRRAVATLLS